MLETLPTQVHLGNDRKDDDDDDGIENVVNAYTTGNKKRQQYSHRQVNQNGKWLLKDSGSLIMIVNGCHPHDWIFKIRK